MNLAGAHIQGADAAITVVDGLILEAFRNRRRYEAHQAPPPGITPRRRRPPTALDTIEPGEIWVVNGHLSVRQRDTRAWTSRGSMRLLANGISFYVVTLKPVLLEPNDDMVMWEFRGLCVPTQEQLVLLPVTEHSGKNPTLGDVSDPLIDFLQQLSSPTRGLH